jgi:hypothetical protein
MIPQRRRGSEKMKKSKVVSKKPTPAQNLLAMFEAAKSKK